MDHSLGYNTLYRKDNPQLKALDIHGVVHSLLYIKGGYL